MKASELRSWLDILIRTEGDIEITLWDGTPITRLAVDTPERPPRPRVVPIRAGGTKANHQQN